MNDPAASGGVSRELFLFAASSGELNPKEIKELAELLGADSQEIKTQRQSHP